MLDRKLYVVAVISNPIRYESRWRLYKEFEARMLRETDAVLITVEQAFGDRPFVITDKDNRNHVQLRAGEESELWVKESLINIGMKHTMGQYPECQYLAWVDADVGFARENWVKETVEALQHFQIVQPWSHSIDMDSYFRPMTTAESFCYSFWIDNVVGNVDPRYKEKNRIIRRIHHPGDCYHHGSHSHVCGFKTTHRYHPGYAWAIRKSTYEKLGGLIDWCVLGSGDYHMAWSFAGNYEYAVDKKGATEGNIRALKKFFDRCQQVVAQDIGYVSGSILHYWHGPKAQRYYIERVRALIDANFDPDEDIARTAQGLVILTGKNKKLRDTIRAYMRLRNEDMISKEF